jgi:predicted transcriptional regulator
MTTVIRDIMTRDVVTLDSQMTLTQLDRVLVSENVSGGPVLEDGAVVGVVSRTDVIRTLYDEQMAAANVSGFYGSPYPIPIPALEHLAQDSRRIADHMTTMQVCEIMSRDVKSVGPDDDVEAVARLMAAEGYHRVPVLEGTRLVGIVTSLDVVRLVGQVGLGGR